MPSDRHINKYFSEKEKLSFSINDYWLLFSLKEADFKFLQKYICLNNFYPKKIIVNNNLKYIEYLNININILKIEYNKNYIHCIVGLNNNFNYKICNIYDYRDNFIDFYIKKYKKKPIIKKEINKLSPNGYSPPIIINDFTSSISFSNDGQYGAWAHIKY